MCSGAAHNHPNLHPLHHLMPSPRHCPSDSLPTTAPHRPHHHHLPLLLTILLSLSPPPLESSLHPSLSSLFSHLTLMFSHTHFPLERALALAIHLQSSETGLVAWPCPVGLACHGRTLTKPPEEHVTPPMEPEKSQLEVTTRVPHRNTTPSCTTPALTGPAVITPQHGLLCSPTQTKGQTHTHAGYEKLETN